MIWFNQSEFGKLLHELGHVFRRFFRSRVAGFPEPKIAKNKNKRSGLQRR